MVRQIAEERAAPGMSEQGGGMKCIAGEERLNFSEVAKTLHACSVMEVGFCEMMSEINKDCSRLIPPQCFYFPNVHLNPRSVR